MAGHGITVGVDLVKSSDTTLPSPPYVRIRAKPDDDVVVVYPSGEEKSLIAGSSATQTVLKVDGGMANSQFPDYLLRLDFGNGGANINPSGSTT